MSTFKPVTPKTLPEVMIRLSAFALEGDLELKKAFCLWLNTVLDNLGNEDAFGTEGQSDPRGDHRD